MIKIENTIFISYRRANAAWALAIYQYLTQNAYDVFLILRELDQVILSE
jgi:hypothetical protein